MTNTDAKPLTLAVLQPGYLPWLGFFDQLRRTDVFVYYDDVQFDKHGWRNRNRIKTPAGPAWLTVPVRHAGLNRPLIKDVEVQPGPWARKHIGSIRQYYGRARFFDRYIGELAAVLEAGHDRLLDLDLAATALMCRWLGLERRTVLSSDLGIAGDRSERLLRICQHFGATTYLSGAAAKTYLDVDLFAGHGIAVEWQQYDHPVYPQLHGAFVPYLSTLDLIMNCGDESLNILALRAGDTTA
jgi:hypothetical protein